MLATNVGWTGDLHISFFDIMINTQIAGLLMDN